MATPPLPTTPSDNQQGELAKINKELYNQNFELAIRNKTLSVLHIIFTIMVDSTSAKESSERIAEAIAKELNFASVSLALINEGVNKIQFIAISEPNISKSAFQSIVNPDEYLGISLKDSNNLMAKAITDKERKVSGNLLDILTPLATQEEADKIENETHTKTIISYPLFLGQRALGVLNLGLAKKVDDLSRGEKETLDELIDAVTIAINRAQLIENINSANNQLTTANEKLKKLDQMKDEFISIASHDLRSPMATVKNYVWLAKSEIDSLPEKAKADLNIALESTEHGIALVADMLDVSRIEAGRIQLNPEKLNVKTETDLIIKELQKQATDKKVQLSSEISEELLAMADKERIHQVITNLVGNAIKFTPAEGKVTIKASLVDKMISVSVTDNGIGISEKDIGKLFTKFGKLETGTNIPSSAGTGLGLYISKNIVELSGGTIKVESEPNKGSIFTFTLPTV